MSETSKNQIKSDLGRFCAAWKANDGHGVGSFFTEDGALVNPFGERADGRKAVSAMYAEYFGGMLRGTSTTYEPARVRLVGDDHAFVDGQQLVYGPDGKVLLDVHLAALLRRDGDAWRFVDARPYAYVASPR